ncbi:MAG: DUF1343 domain-containing protein [Chloroflexi bacterium]|nr:DUF1343 domain-containing protein [Chloroflexota bacterium]MCY4246224.1 DUF1343 domain-containing protein [Chloroflexota bacterium]
MVMLGLEVFLRECLDLAAGKRAALLACPSSIDSQLRSSRERLHAESAVNLVALFGPEHGLRGAAQAGSPVQNARDPLTNLPVHSLYGQTHTPTPAMLRGIDIILIDLPDGGARFYTYLATALNVLRAAAESGSEVVLLDRPAPLGGARVEGPVLRSAWRSFVGPFELPVRYGMTIGEVARLVNAAEIGCDLTVVPMRGWRRDMTYADTGLPFVPSSPNLPTPEAMLLYPGACLLEGTNLSEARGTTKPFEYFGAPWIHAEELAAALNGLGLAGLRFRPVYFVPTFSKHQDELCAGVQIYMLDRETAQPVAAMLHVLQAIKMRYADDFAWREAWQAGAPPPIDLLYGSDDLRLAIDAGRPVDELIAGWQDDLRAFEALRARHLLYPEG